MVYCILLEACNINDLKSEIKDGGYNLDVIYISCNCGEAEAADERAQDLNDRGPDKLG